MKKLFGLKITIVIVLSIVSVGAQTADRRIAPEAQIYVATG
jgi:hypothetical protein